MAVLYDNSGSTVGSAVTSVTITSFTPVSTTNGAITVGIHFGAALARTISTVTINGASVGGSAKKTEYPTNAVRCEMWGAVNTASGNVVVTASGSCTVLGAGVISYINVNQTTPFGTFVSANGISTSPSVTPSGAVGDIFVDACTNATTTSTAVGGSQTLRYNPDASFRATGSTAPGAASLAMIRTLGTPVQWAIIAVAVKGNLTTSYAQVVG